MGDVRGRALPVPVAHPLGKNSKQLGTSTISSYPNERVYDLIGW